MFMPSPVKTEEALCSRCDCSSVKGKAGKGKAEGKGKAPKERRRGAQLPYIGR